MSRRDDINTLYQSSKTLRRVCIGLFSADAVLSITAVYASEKAVPYISILLIVTAFLYMALSIIDDGIVWYQAESSRRKNSIQVAFNVKLANYETQGYYNNNIKNPELSYIINQFESSFFTKEISEKMIPCATIKMLTAIGILIISCRLIVNDEVLLVIAQSVFSAVVIEDSIRLIIFTQKIRGLFDEAYHELITVGISNRAQRVWLRFFCVEYESIKAHYRIRLDESLFKKLNSRLSQEWKMLSEQIKILPEE